MEELTVATWSAWLADWEWSGERRERLAVPAALGRVLAEPVRAERHVPAGAVAAVTGLAVRAAQTGTNVYLQLGAEAEPVTAGQPLPTGYDAVLTQSDYWLSGQAAWLVDRAAPGAGVSEAGSEFAPGQLVLSAGQTLTGAALVACLAAGVMRVDVVRRPRLAVFPFGEAWAEPGGQLAATQLPETGSLLLAAAAQDWGAEPQVHPIVATEAQLRERLSLAAKSADVLAVIDSSRQVGVGSSRCGDKPCLHLPGPPDQLWLACLRWLQPLLAHWYGRQTEPRPVTEVIVARRPQASPAGCLLLTAKVGGQPVAWPLPGVLGRYESAIAANAISAVTADVTADELMAVELLEPAAAMQQRVLLAAPPAATAVAPPVLTPAYRVHMLTMDEAEARAACAAGYVHGRLEQQPGGWALYPAPAIAASHLHELLQAAFAPAGPAAPDGWAG